LKITESLFKKKPPTAAVGVVTNSFYGSCKHSISGGLKVVGDNTNNSGRELCVA